MPPQKTSYRAFMRFLARMSTHVNDQHVLSFEWFLFAGAFLPATDETLFVGVNVVVVDVFHQIVLCGEFFVAIAPVAMRFNEIAWLVLHRVTRSIVTVVVHRFATVQMMMVMVTVFAGHGRLDHSGSGYGRSRHRFFLDFRTHFHDFHVSFRVYRARHWIVLRLFLGRLVFGLDAGVMPAVEMSVRAEAHRRRMVTQSRS